MTNTVRQPATKRVHVEILYILRAPKGCHRPTLRPKYIPYSYMDNWDSKQFVLGLSLRIMMSLVPPSESTGPLNHKFSKVPGAIMILGAL